MSEEWSQAPFWSAVAQVTPVFALALTLEARALAAQWKLDERVRRSGEGGLLLLLAVTLLFSFTSSLAVLARAENVPQLQVAIAAIALAFVFVGMSYNALVLTVTKGTVDLWMNAAWRVPFSKNRRLHRKAKKAIVEALADCETAIPRAKENLERHRTTLMQEGTLDDDETAEHLGFRDYLTTTPGPPQLSVNGLEKYVRRVEKYEQSPTPKRAKRVRKASEEVASQLLAIAKMQRVKLKGHLQELENFANFHSGYRYTEVEKERLEELIRSAQQPTLLPSLSSARASRPPARS